MDPSKKLAPSWNSFWRVVSRDEIAWAAMNRLFSAGSARLPVLPGTFAFVVPLLLLAPGAPGPSFDALGLVTLVLGIVLLLWCVRDFYLAGRGTAAPWAPPREAHVVTMPLFAQSINIAVVLVLWGLGGGISLAVIDDLCSRSNARIQSACRVRRGTVARPDARRENGVAALQARAALGPVSQPVR